MSTPADRPHVVGDGVLVHDEGAVRVVSFNRASRRNALDLPDRRDLLAALASAEDDPEIGVVVLTGEGGVFCAGGDIRTMSSDPVVARERVEVAGDVARALVQRRTPVVAAVEGGAYGLGLAVAAACDLVVAAADARFTASFGRLGLVTDTGLAWTLPRRVGPARAQRMVLTAEVLDAVDALAWGLADEVVPPGTTRARALELATDLATRSRPMVAGAKRIAAMSGSLDDVLVAETDTQVDLMGGPDFAEGQAAFLARRPARFRAT